MTRNRRLKAFPAFVLLNIIFGTAFAGLAVSAANATEGDGTPVVTETPVPTETTAPDTTTDGSTANESTPVTTVPAHPRATRPVRSVSGDITKNDDGSVDVAWADGDRDNTDPNYDLFADLVFHVSNTENLSYQVVDVTWVNGVTSPQGEFSRNYVQIMQCWDDGSGTAKPENCQWGAPSSALSSIAGNNAAGRGLIENEDAAQSYADGFRIPPPRTNPNLRQFAVPFVSVDGKRDFNVLSFFDSTLTNEITGAPTANDGTGSQPFEVHTSLEAPHLGCGAVQPGGAVQDCWLVIVPRGEYNTAGIRYTDNIGSRLNSSPLSASNWADRIEIPLTFKSVVSGCAIGAEEQGIVGNEIVGPAFSSWQAFLCRDSAVFGFSQIGDSEARRQIVSELDSAARLAIVSDPLDDTTAGTATLEYAPVAQSATVIAFNINYLLGSNSDIFDKNGTLVTDLTLNARLVAKMLTQSYRNDVPDGDNQLYLRSNPRSLNHDPEFLALNPEFNDFVGYIEPAGLLTALGNSDAYSAVWKWIRADEDALAFISGTEDEWGMKVNPYYEALGIDADTTLDSFPKADQSTFREYSYIPDPGYSSFELRPYVLDMAESALKVLRADPGSKIYWDETRNPAAFISQGAQPLGRRFMLGVTDFASAQRLGLSVAHLVNFGGHAVAPSEDSIAAGIAEFTDSEVSGVSVFNPKMTGSNSYPLASIDYAVVNVCAASDAQLRDYATLLDFVAGDGQHIGSAYGDLPDGYVPLSDADREATRAISKALTSEVKSPECAEHVTTIDTTTTDSTLLPPVVDADGPGIVDTPLVNVAAGETPRDPSSAAKFAILSALCFGIPSIAAGRVLVRKGMDLPT